MTVEAVPATPARWLPLRFALRELRGGLHGFYVFIACIALGSLAIAGVGSLAASLADGLAREGWLVAQPQQCQHGGDRIDDQSHARDRPAAGQPQQRHAVGEGCRQQPVDGAVFQQPGAFDLLQRAPVSVWLRYLAGAGPLAFLVAVRVAFLVMSG